MKKVLLLTLASHREATLGALRDLGVVHITPLRAPAGGDIDAVRRLVDDGKAVLGDLVRLARENKAAPVAARPGVTPEHLLKTAKELQGRIRERADRIQRLEEAIRHVEPLGRFEPDDLRDLVGRGVSVRLFKGEPKMKLDLPGDAILEELSRDKTAFYFALVNAPGWNSPGVTELAIPERSLDALVRERDDLRRGQGEDQRALADLAPLHPVAERAVAVETDRLRWLEAREGMASEGPLLLLQGYLPADQLPLFEKEAAGHGWGWLAEDPADTDEVPTLLRSPRWARPIQVVIDMLGILPGYREVDISAIFLVFFSLFFAILIGDAAYGLLFLGMTALIHKKWKDAPKNLVPLLAILSMATIIWGVLTGSYLGIEGLPAPLERLKVDWLTDPIQIQKLCFFIGALHMTVAHGWNVWLQRRSVTALSHLGWIGSCWTMFFLANYLVLGLSLPSFVGPLFGVSVAAILLFTVPFKRIKSEATSLLMLPLSIIGNFGDVISYLRLYLVGSASAVLVKAFNGLAFGDGPVSFWGGLIGAVILFLVHALNIMLGALAVLVHGIRLNALEFSSHMGIQWLGRKYTPFRRSLHDMTEPTERTIP